MMLAVILGSSLYVLGWTGLHLPDMRLTPGMTVELTQDQVCSTQWGKDVRHVTEAMKKQVCGMYGARGPCPGPAYEIDHLIPRELGGADDVKNLWPQPIKEARLKDHVENFLHHQVCMGRRELHDAQEAIRVDWTQEYRKMTGDNE